ESLRAHNKKGLSPAETLSGRPFCLPRGADPSLTRQQLQPVRSGRARRWGRAPGRVGRWTRHHRPLRRRGRAGPKRPPRPVSKLRGPEGAEGNIDGEATYQVLYVQARGSATQAGDTPSHRPSAARPARPGSAEGVDACHRGVLITEQPAEATDRAVPGHWNGDLLIAPAISDQHPGRAHHRVGPSRLCENARPREIPDLLPSTDAPPASRSTAASHITLR
ncbi:MAG: putative transposase, partial [Actinotalea sp.]|nr:putative transposase [Actinotalea sp.]